MDQTFHGRNTISLWLRLLIALLLIVGVVFSSLTWRQRVQQKVRIEAVAACEAAVQVEQWEEAALLCQIAVERSPSDPVVFAFLATARQGLLNDYYHQGEVLLNAGKFIAAVEAFDHVLEDDPDFLDVMTLRTQALLAMTPPPTAVLSLPPTIPPDEPTPTPTLTETSTPVSTATPSPNTAATATSRAVALEAAVMATLTMQAQETKQMLAVVATLTARVPTPTFTFIPTSTPTLTRKPTNTRTATPNHTKTVQALERNAADKILKTASEFYIGLDKGVETGDFTDAYRLMSRDRQAQRSYGDLVRVYSDTRDVTLVQLSLLSQSRNKATVEARVKLQLVEHSRLVDAYYQVVYDMVFEDGNWKMDSYQATRE